MKLRMMKEMKLRLISRKPVIKYKIQRPVR